MKKLPLPHYVDSTIINQLANNTRLHKTSYPHLLNNLILIQSQYQHYINNNGNALSINSQPIPITLKNALSNNFDSPPKELNHLEVLRNYSKNICPMCGSKNTGTLDHLFPREDYPEWTVFSWNLVPACKCNSIRGRTLVGAVANNERILHPYFDNVLLNRNLSCSITPINGYRIVDITLDCIAYGAELNAIQYHIEEVIKKNGIKESLEDEWIKIYQKPRTIINTLPKNDTIVDMNELNYILDDFLEILDERYGTPNNWDSILIHGILRDNNAKEFIMQRHNDIVNGIINPEDN